MLHHSGARTQKQMMCSCYAGSPMCTEPFPQLVDQGLVILYTHVLLQALKSREGLHQRCLGYVTLLSKVQLLGTEHCSSCSVVPCAQ